MIFIGGKSWILTWIKKYLEDRLLENLFYDMHSQQFLGGTWPSILAQIILVSLIKLEAVTDFAF